MSTTSAASTVEIQTLAGYQPSGKIGRLGLPYLLITLLLLPPAAAFLYVKTAHFGGSVFSSIWALVITSALLGAVVGAGFFPAIQFGHVRNVPVAVVFGLLAGALVLPLSMGIEAMEHRDEVAKQKSSEASALSPVQVTKLYWQSYAQGGIKVTGRRAREANIDGGMFWALTGIQWLLAALTAAVGALLWANRRYSEEAGRWYISKTIGNVLPQRLPDLIAAGNAADWTRFARVMNESKDPQFKEFKPIISVHYLPATAGGTLQVRAIPDPKKPIATVFEHELTSEQMKVVWPEFPALGQPVSQYSLKPGEPSAE